MSEITLGQYLRLLRIQRGWSQNEAERRGSFGHDFHHWEREDYVPSEDTLKRLAQVFEVPVGDLLELARHARRRRYSYRSHGDPTRVRCQRCTIYLEEGDDFEGKMCAECIKDLEKEARHARGFRLAL